MPSVVRRMVPSVEPGTPLKRAGRPVTLRTADTTARTSGSPRSTRVASLKPLTGAHSIVTPGRRAIAACQRAMARRPGVTIEWAPVNGFRLATRVERGEPLVRAVVSAVRRVTGRPARFSGVPGSTDGTILRTTLGIPIVTLGPGNRLIPHQVDEYVETDELIEAARIFAVAALRFLES